MKFDGFEIHAFPRLTDAHCSCGDKLHEVSNGWFSAAFYCPKCENVYVIKKIKLPNKKVTKEFLKQCREEVAIEKIKGEKIKAYLDKKK